MQTQVQKYCVLPNVTAREPDLLNPATPRRLALGTIIRKSLLQINFPVLRSRKRGQQGDLCCESLKIMANWGF